MKPLLVLNVVGLSQNLIGEHTPFIAKLIRSTHQLNNYAPILPAVTCSVQASLLTGELPSTHGIVGNGWYFNDLCEVLFWKQSYNLIQSETLWDAIKKDFPKIKTANLFWWYNMYSPADYSVTPRPMYPADGTKIPDCYSKPLSLRDELTQKFGVFPLFKFWGPMTSVESTRWIANATEYVQNKYNPDLNLVYLPHLDYCLQKHGPNISKISNDLKEIDQVIEWICTHPTFKDHHIVLLSEYGISSVNHAIDINKILRKNNYVTIKNERNLDMLDPGASKAFAVCDHQIAHVYVKNKYDIQSVALLLKEVDGIENILTRKQLNLSKQNNEAQSSHENKFLEHKDFGLDNDRSGDIVCLAKNGYWFNYHFWLDDNKAPDYARTVDIHRKPGYDPLELFLDNKTMFPKLKVLLKLVIRKLKFRALLNVIGFDTSQVKGSHGVTPTDKSEYPVFIIPSNLNTGDLRTNNKINPLNFKSWIISYFNSVN